MSDKKKILIVIDMQHDFVDGSLGSEAAQAIVPKVEAKIASGEYDHIYFTLDTHNERYLDTLEGKKLPVSHCIIETPGWQLAINGGNKGIRISKNTFGFTNWVYEIRFGFDDMNDVEDQDIEFEICGLCTDICVISNALILRADFKDSVIICDASCCAGTTLEAHKAALTVMKSCQIDVINE